MNRFETAAVIALVAAVAAAGAWFALRGDRRGESAAGDDRSNDAIAGGASKKSPSISDRPRGSTNAATPPTATTAATPKFAEVAKSLGIDYRYFPDFRENRFLLPENMGGGAAWIDFDGDGRLDVFLPNGCVIPVDPADRSHAQQLYRQRPGGQFESVAADAGVDLVLYAQGVTAGDADNDGFPDLVVTALGSVVFLHNNGDGTISEATAAAGIVDPGWSVCAAMGDADRDGALDLYISHYGVISLTDGPVCHYNGPGGVQVRGFCGPDKYDGEPDGFFLNEGTLRFRDAGDRLSPVKPSKGLGVAFADLNNDGWPEIYVANDMQDNFLFLNRGGSAGESVSFSEIGGISGTAVSGDGTPEASMGVAIADFRGVDLLDIFLTHYFLQKNTYYENLSKPGLTFFQDHSVACGVAPAQKPFLGFGTVPIDYDSDGWQDLFITNGHVLGKLVKPYEMQPQLYRNQGRGKFVEVKAFGSPYFRSEWVGRGCAMADFDDDGDDDLVVTHLNDQPVALLRNDTARAGAVIGLELVGTASNRSAIGARVHVRVGDTVRMREIIGGGTYNSSNDTRLLVGLGPDATAADVEIAWPSGQVDRGESLAAGRYWRIFEGRAPREGVVWEK